ncbi:hypothetical protein BC936DRAFT_148985 [Jimgerdemannia flammicorona]|uniref:Uncharacterized protein n=1 Tax=Jimgerdemannia flammicorona TaxID=994334 RepID=A0A433D1V4_9FUNG|nr:hypothetical protein BC936DRAFT_148985 [Jimgerdemannia flammicorona]
MADFTLFRASVLTTPQQERVSLCDIKEGGNNFDFLDGDGGEVARDGRDELLAGLLCLNLADLVDAFILAQSQYVHRVEVDLRMTGREEGFE